MTIFLFTEVQSEQEILFASQKPIPLNSAVHLQEKQITWFCYLVLKGVHSLLKVKVIMLLSGQYVSLQKAERSYRLPKMRESLLFPSVTSTCALKTQILQQMSSCFLFKTCFETASSLIISIFYIYVIQIENSHRIANCFSKSEINRFISKVRGLLTEQYLNVSIYL